MCNTESAKILAVSLFLRNLRVICIKEIKGIVSDSNNIFLWHESKDISKISVDSNLTWIYKLCMIMCIGIAP